MKHALLAAAVLAGCATGSYNSPPPLPTADQNQRTYSAPYDRVWEAVVDHASSTFFAIDSFEKSSGLMTLSFGAQDAARFVDCGRFQMTAPAAHTSFDGSYAQYVAERFGATLSGKMNLTVRRLSDDATTVRVNARYIFTIPSPSGLTRETFAFDTTSRAALQVTNSTPGTSARRECQATQVAEREILDGVAAALAK